MRAYPSAGIAVADVLLPKPGSDLTKWAVVACDQYTSEPEYWQKADAFVGDAPSTLRIIYPEVFLGERDPEARIRAIRKAMSSYLAAGLLVPHEGLVYVERHAAGKTRSGLVLALDLEHYDYSKGSTSLVRATEGTILERIPPRVTIRQGAPLESPHIMVLIDDPEERVLGPVRAKKAALPALYHFDLMMSSGHLDGYLVDDRALEAGVMAALSALRDPGAFRAKYGFDRERPVLLYAMGDGNHSLATAKAIWESTKQAAADRSAVMSAPTRYALVEIVNVHDPALEFEPIHRVLFELAAGRDPIDELRKHYGPRLRLEACGSVGELKVQVDAPAGGVQRIGVIRPQGYAVAELRQADTNLPVGSLQAILDAFMQDKGAAHIDYVHGTEPVDALGRKPGNVGFYLPAMDKHELFKSVIMDGALPRKTFSMGEAFEKRFYMECRRIG
jgi:hypothetical protein